MHKCPVFLFITCLVASCLIVYAVTPVSAQSGYKPYAPQFSAKFIDNSYDVSPFTTTTVNLYTGEETTITTPGHRVIDKTIEVKVTNHSFTQYRTENGYVCDLYYTVQVKGHFGGEQDWHTLYNNVGGLSYDQGNYIAVDSQSFTIVMSPNPFSMYSLHSNLYYSMMTPGNQLDFRVKEFVAYYDGYFGRDESGYEMVFPQQVIVKSSDWSSIQTITIPDVTASSAPPLQTATWPSVTSEGDGQPQYSDQTQPPASIFSNPFFTFGVGALFAGVIIVVVLVFLRRHIKTPTYTNNSLRTDSHSES
jgi:hypothetical protein